MGVVDLIAGGKEDTMKSRKMDNGIVWGVAQRGIVHFVSEATWSGQDWAEWLRVLL